MDMCRNLQTIGYLYECNMTYIWIIFATICFMFLMTLIAVILGVKAIIQKYKRKGEMDMCNTKKQVQSLLDIGVHGQAAINNDSFHSLQEAVALCTKTESQKMELAQKLARAKVKSEYLKQGQLESELLLEAIDVTNKQIDFRKLELIATNSGTPLECVLIEHAPAGISYNKPEESCAVISKLKNNDEALGILIESKLDNVSDLSDLTFSTVDTLITLYADYDVTEEVKFITGQLVISQLKGNCRKTKREEYILILKNINAELSKDAYTGLSPDVDEHKAAIADLAINNDDLQESDFAKHESSKLTSSQELDLVEHESFELTSSQETSHVESTSSDELCLSKEDDEFLSQMFDQISALRFKIKEWRIEIKQPINFNLIGSDKVKQLKEIAELQMKGHPENLDYVRVYNLLNETFNKM